MFRKDINNFDLHSLTCFCHKHMNFLPHCLWWRCFDSSLPKTITRSSINNYCTNNILYLRNVLCAFEALLHNTAEEYSYSFIEQTTCRENKRQVKKAKLNRGIPYQIHVTFKMSPGINRHIYFIEPKYSKYIYKGIYVFTLKTTAVNIRIGAS